MRPRSLPPSVLTHNAGLVVHRTINEGPALGRARGTPTSELPNRTGVAAHENQNKPNVVSSRAAAHESPGRELSEMPAKFWRRGHIRGVIRQQGAYEGTCEGALIEAADKRGSGKCPPHGIIVWYGNSCAGEAKIL